jgi:hypothetical protein
LDLRSALLLLLLPQLRRQHQQLLVRGLECRHQQLQPCAACPCHVTFLRLRFHLLLLLHALLWRALLLCA